jgi:histidinol-phosphatase
MAAVAPLPAAEGERATEVARRAAEAAGAAALSYWRTDLRIERKPDRTPVTAADRAAEAAALNLIRAAFPTHGILSEESGAEREGAASRWIVDPLDGTKGFSRGGPFWGPAVALEHGGAIVAGAIALPALGEVYWAGQGLGAYRDGTRLQVSAVDDLADATLSLGEMSCLLAPPYTAAVAALIQAAHSARAFGDVYACTLLLNGRADLWIEAGVQIWDIAPLQILVEEAGGRFTDFAGVPTVATGTAIGSNGRLHAAALARLRAPA